MILLFSFTPNIREFNIIVYDIHENVFYKSIKIFGALYVDPFIDNQLVFYEAFHNELSEFKNQLLFTDMYFIKVDANSIYENDLKSSNSFYLI